MNLKPLILCLFPLSLWGANIDIRSMNTNSFTTNVPSAYYIGVSTNTNSLIYNAITNLSGGPGPFVKMNAGTWTNGTVYKSLTVTNNGLGGYMFITNGILKLGTNVLPTISLDGTVGQVTLNNSLDTDIFVFLQSGVTANQREYLTFNSYLGANNWQFGRNSDSTLITYDSIANTHREELFTGGISYYNSSGSAAVILNGLGEATDGTGGLRVSSGGTSPTVWLTVAGATGDGFANHANANYWVKIDSGLNATQKGMLSFQDSGSEKYWFGRNDDNTFTMRDTTLGEYISTWTSGNLSLSRSLTVATNINCTSGQFNGNGGGLTNIAGASIQTNWVSGKIYTNTSSSDWYVRALGTWTTAAVTGDAEIDLVSGSQGGAMTRISGAGASTTVAVTLSQSYTNEIGGFINSGQIFAFTNSSNGVGNTSGLVAGTGQKKQW